MKTFKKIITTIIIGITLINCLSIGCFATYFTNGAGTYETYINADSSFSSYYYTNSKPTMEYRYKNLICNNTNATLGVTLYAMKINWYSIFGPSEYEVGTKICSGLNANNSNWYGWTYENIDCASVAEIKQKWTSYTYDDAYNLRYYYDVSNNGSEYIYNYDGEWQVICTY